MGGRVLRRGSKKGLSRRHVEGREVRLFESTTPLACALDIFETLRPSSDQRQRDDNKNKISDFWGGGLGGREENRPKRCSFVGNATTIKFWKCTNFIVEKNLLVIAQAPSYPKRLYLLLLLLIYRDIPESGIVPGAQAPSYPKRLYLAPSLIDLQGHPGIGHCRRQWVRVKDVPCGYKMHGGCQGEEGLGFPKNLLRLLFRITSRGKK